MQIVSAPKIAIMGAMRKMTDRKTTIAQLRRKMAAFVAERQWEKFHRPKNLAMSLAIEAGELMEHFQWLDHRQTDRRVSDPLARKEIADEMADVLSFLLSLANAAFMGIGAYVAALLTLKHARAAATGQSGGAPE